MLKTIVKGNDVHEYGAYYLKNGTYYAYFHPNLVKSLARQEPGYSNAALNTDGGKQFQTFMLLDQSSLTYSLINSFVLIPLECLFGQTQTKKITNTEV